MPRQIVTLEVEYPAINDDGDTDLSPPSTWPWEEMADEYAETHDDDTWTETVSVVSYGPVQPSEDDADEKSITEWHRANCSGCGEELCPVQ